MNDQTEPKKKRRKGFRVSSHLLLVALNLVNEKTDQIRAAGLASYMNSDLPELRASIIKELTDRGDWTGSE